MNANKEIFPDKNLHVDTIIENDGGFSYMCKELSSHNLKAFPCPTSENEHLPSFSLLM